MENFVFPDEIKTKFMKMYELMNIFPILTGIPQKSCKRSFSIFIKKQSKRPFCFELVLSSKCINQKKAQRKNLVHVTF